MINIEAQQRSSGISGGRIKLHMLKMEKNCYGANEIQCKVKLHLSNLRLLQALRILPSTEGGKPRSL